MSSVFNFFKQRVSPTYLGVDIGTTTIKIAEVRQGKQQPELVNYGILETSGYLARANQAIQTSDLKLFEKGATEFLETVLREMKPQSNEAYATIPAFAAFMTTLDFPEMSPADLANAIVFQARQYVPLPLSEVVIDWMKVNEFTDDRNRVFWRDRRALDFGSGSGIRVTLGISYPDLPAGQYFLNTTIEDERGR